MMLYFLFSLSSISLHAILVLKGKRIMSSSSKKLKDIFSLDDIACFCNMMSPDVVDDHIAEWNDAYSEAFSEAIKENKTEEEAENIASEASDNARDEEFSRYVCEVISTAEKLFGFHHLNIEEIKKKNNVVVYKISPQETWRKAANEIRETINGVGMFHTYSLRDFLDSGPYTPKEAVLTHLHWLKDYPKVYGIPFPTQKWRK